MRTGRIIIGVAGTLAVSALVASNSLFRPDRPGETNAVGQTMLPNGWAVTPAGRHIALSGDMPLAMTLTPDGKRLIVSTGGYHDQGVTMVDVDGENVVGKLDLKNAWAGMALSGDQLYVSGGPQAVKLVTVTADGMQRQPDFATVPKSGWTSGIATLNDAVFVADVNQDLIARHSGGKSETFKEPGRPYGLAISPDGSTLATSDWGTSMVTLRDPSTMTVRASVAVGSHPNALTYGPDGRLFVACSGSNSVSVIRDGAAVETIRTSMDPRDPVGSTPDAVAVAPDGKTLFVANADNNDVAVIDVSGKESVVKGFIPTGWYPSTLAVSQDGKKLFVGTGKGLRFESNGYVNKEGKPAFKYIDSLLQGTLSVVDVPDTSKLSEYTQQVLNNAPKPTGSKLVAADSKVLSGALRKIKHVVFIIRENRTYDQVFGDMGKGASDPTLVMFGRDVTPNAHSMADNFVLLDNTFCNGEVSEDGHQWCNGAYADDFVERAYVNSYSGRGEPNDEDDVADSPAGYMWDNCRKHGESYESYGEYANFTSTPNSRPKFRGTRGLEGHASLAWSQLQKGSDYGRDYNKVQVFIDDLHQAEKSGDWYNYMVMSLGEDHTSGLRPGSFTPDASVGSNDLGLGKIVDAVSHSKYWKDTAIFIIEDDAQNGPDHVDAHRTAALVISPYVKRHELDSTMYSTASLVKTMELILGLPPMTQFDQRATPMFASFTDKPDFTPYDAIVPSLDLQAKNPETGALELASAKLDWSHYDAADPDKLNAILWKALKGSSPMPAPVRSPRLALSR